MQFNIQTLLLEVRGLSISLKCFLPCLKLNFAKLNCVDMSLKVLLYKFSHVTTISEWKTNQEVKRTASRAQTALWEDTDLLKATKTFCCTEDSPEHSGLHHSETWPRTQWSLWLSSRDPGDSSRIQPSLQHYANLSIMADRDLPSTTKKNKTRWNFFGLQSKRDFWKESSRSSSWWWQSPSNTNGQAWLFMLKCKIFLL